MSDSKMTAREIADELCVCLRTLAVYIQRDQFPPPSFVSPGQVGKRVWFRETFEVWFEDYIFEQDINGLKRADAARRATVAAIKHDEKLKAAMKERRARRASDWESDHVIPNSKANGSEPLACQS